MIITRSPLRVSLGGGGTDLPSYYREHEGFLIAAAIDKYVYITLHQTFVDEMIIKYSQLERVKSVAEIHHPIIRESLQMLGINDMSLELASMADIPAGTGLGSSGSFTTALLRALHAYRRDLVQAEDIASEACRIEIERLHEPIGKQDQYIAAYGGITCFRFLKDDRVEAAPLKMSPYALNELQDGLMLFFTGYMRSASGVLKDQDQRTKKGDSTMLESMHAAKEIGVLSKAALESGKLCEFGDLMDQHWKKKRVRSESMTNSRIDEWYALAKANGALGGKLIGAGGGGFLMFYAEEKARLRRAMHGAGLREVRFHFDFEGTKVVWQ